MWKNDTSSRRGTSVAVASLNSFYLIPFYFISNSVRHLEIGYMSNITWLYLNRLYNMICL
jgi:hypothetical protein